MKTYADAAENQASGNGYVEDQGTEKWFSDDPAKYYMPHQVLEELAELGAIKSLMQNGPKGRYGILVKTEKEKENFSDRIQEEFDNGKIHFNTGGPPEQYVVVQGISLQYLRKAIDFICDKIFCKPKSWGLKISWIYYWEWISKHLF